MSHPDYTQRGIDNIVKGMKAGGADPRKIEVQRGADTHFDASGNPLSTNSTSHYGNNRDVEGPEKNRIVRADGNIVNGQPRDPLTPQERDGKKGGRPSRNRTALEGAGKDNPRRLAKIDENLQAQQRYLEVHGIKLAQYGADGRMGKETKAAMEKFKQEHGGKSVAQAMAEEKAAAHKADAQKAAAHKAQKARMTMAPKPNGFA